MLKLFVQMQNFLAEPVRRDDRGATAVEYGLLVALIAAVIVTVVAALGTKLSSMFNSVTNSI
jgi:pilus assembly protein Flp/PilA